MLAALALWGTPLQAAPIITVQPASQAVWAGSNVTFTVTTADTGPFAYHWQFNGTNLPNNLINTVVGNGTTSALGDGGAATNAALYNPWSVSVDSSGALYIADSSHRRIRRVDTNGIVTTVAGGGTGGDGALATNAALSIPSGVAVSPTGQFYIADRSAHRIRMVDTNGIITTVAGNGTSGYGGDGGLATNASLSGPYQVALDTSGNLYIADTLNNRIRRVDGSGVITSVAGGSGYGSTGDGGPATNALLHNPTAVALDGFGNLFIADQLNNQIRKVDTNGIITRVAGKTLAGLLGDWGPATNAALSSPYAVTVDAYGNLYIADTSHNRIRQVDTSGIITTLAGLGTAGYSDDGGAANNARLNAPSGVALDSVGNLFIADTSNYRIREVALAGYPTLTLSDVTAASVGGYAVVVTGSGGSVTSSIARLDLLGVPVIVTQPADRAVWAGHDTILAVTATGSAPLNYQWLFNGGTPVAEGTNAALLITQAHTNLAGKYTVVISNSYGSITSSAAMLRVNELPTGPDSQTVLAGNPVTLSVEVAGGGPLQYQWQFNGTNLPNNVITTIAGTTTDGFSGDGSPATNALLNWPERIRFDRWGNLYVADTRNSRIRKIDTNGIITTVVGTGVASNTGDGGPATSATLYSPNDVIWDAAGNMYIGDHTYVRKVDTNGIITTFAGNGTITFSGSGGPATNAGVYDASGLSMDSQGQLLIAEHFNNVVCRVDTNGIITTVAGTGTLGFSGDGGPATQALLWAPTYVMVDAEGNWYIADDQNYRVRKVDTNGIIRTVVGQGTSADIGDGGPAIYAGLNWPQTLTMDVQGNLYIADSSHFRIRVVDTNGIIRTVAGNGTQGFAGDGGAATNAQMRFPTGVTLDSSGNLFLTDSSRIRKVALAGFPTLTLSNPMLSDAGEYRVIITSLSGSVTSQVATLTVQVRPSFTSIVPQTNGTVALNLTGTPNSTNRLWVTSDLTSPVNWMPLSTNVASADGTWQCTDPNPIGGSGRLYRVSMP